MLQEAKQDLRNNERQYMKYQNFQFDNPDLYDKRHHGKLEHNQQLINASSTALGRLKTNETAQDRAANRAGILRTHQVTSVRPTSDERYY